ncbi:glycine oxidase ThiO [Hoeflea prorocentri]|uniref:Glycine oxidase ThiO n=1 Tax=Hoeflea prorocentri TaxID=1922333 RepID=A0A9X3ZHB9_9HYPH|nr:glycine oxidase ThiO [Hoeflea prorocentri]MCY6381164.1 glycine oxidase ThiO [Hoeflea prorocentri]MDA5398964.1 glycine oxidase ThiO [Hoeflea prorocentri]
MPGVPVVRILVKGAGVAGLTAAWELCRRGASVTVIDTRDRVGGAASWFAGGMLAPWCEAETAGQGVVDFGGTAPQWWSEALPGHVSTNGTLVVARVRDRAELGHFAGRSSGHQRIDATSIARLEPDLAERFADGLYFPDEAHLDPRAAMQELQRQLTDAGCIFHLGSIVPPEDNYDRIVDCTGLNCSHTDLRGVRGEMLLLRVDGLILSRPVRLLHPRIPVYVVPRGNGLFMIGATMIESASAGPATARSVMELLNAAYALHPAFGEAVIEEIGVGVRPAFPDNFPRVTRNGETISINGFYRHGFLLAPAMAARAAGLALTGRAA